MSERIIRALPGANDFRAPHHVHSLVQSSPILTVKPALATALTIDAKTWRAAFRRRRKRC
jgi:hypothetical protein